MKVKELLDVMDKRASLRCRGTLGSNVFVLKNYVRNTPYTRLCTFLTKNLDVKYLHGNYCVVDTEKLLSNASFDELLYNYSYENSEQLLAVALNNKNLDLCEKMLKILEKATPSIKASFKAEGTWNGNRVVLRPRKEA